MTERPNGAGPSGVSGDFVRSVGDRSERGAALCGRTLGDYRIERRVGGGATSDVFLATQISLGRRVALKILKDELANDETYLTRFLQEARAAARLEHPNIVRIYEVGVLTDERGSGATVRGRFDRLRGRLFGGGSLRRRLFGERRRDSGAKTYRFIAQEFVEGASLRRFLRSNGPTTVAQTLAALEQIASALAKAAEEGVVHRDVKPENVLLDANGTIKVVDFGLAWIAGSLDAVAATALTRSGFALGTPLYMSPEQARGQKLDSRSDVYSLGVVAFQMLTGTPPFQGETPLAVVLKHLNEKPRPLLDVCPNVPAPLAALIDRTLSKKPDDRPTSAELICELRAIRRELDAENGGVGSVGASTVAGKILAPNIAAQNATDSSVDAPRTSFFQSDDERAAFERTLATTILSRQWQENWAKLDAKRNARRGVWTRRRIALAVLSAGLSFALGGGVLAAKNRLIASRSTEPPSTIRRFDSVEEQWVFALQLGTVDAWKCVAEYFPNDEYWKIRAEKQLALVYTNEKNVADAAPIFEKIAATPAPGRDVEPFGLAGLAWAAATENDFERAVAIISELRAAQNGEYDRLTETMIEKTQQTIREKIGVAVVVPRPENRGGGNGPGAGAFGKEGRGGGNGPGTGSGGGFGKSGGPGSGGGAFRQNGPGAGNGGGPGSLGKDGRGGGGGRGRLSER